MNNITIAIVFMGLLIFFSHFFNSIFDKTKIPNVLLLMLIGVAAGFFVDQEQYFGKIGSVFTTITLVVIMFESGANLKFADIKKTIGSASLLTIFNFITTLIVVGTLVKLIFGLPWVSAIFFAAIVGGTSSAVVIPMIRQLRLGEKSETILILESALSDVLCLVVGLAAFEGMKAGALEFKDIMNSMWKAFLFAALIGIAAGLVWSMVLNLIRGVKNSMFTTLAFVFIIYGVVEMLGFNGGIASLCFGIIVGNAGAYQSKGWINKIFRFKTVPLTPQEKDFFSEIVFILQTYFFVYVGLSIKFGNPLIYLFALLLVVLILLMRPLGIKMFVRKGIKPRDFTMMSIMSPKGLVPAVLASLPFQYGLLNGKEIMDLGYAMVLISIIICSILVIIGSKDPLFFNKFYKDRIVPMFGGAKRLKQEELITTDTPESIEEYSSDSENTSDNDDSKPIDTDQTNNKKYNDYFDD
jgi:potassium/hydrogen antiporter